MPDDPTPSLFDPASPGSTGVAGGSRARVNSGGAAAPDGKAPDALRTIGEVAAALGIRQHVLRYWEEQFPMLRPLKRSGSRRYYRPSDVALVERIDQLVHKQGYTLRGARLVLQGKAPEDGATNETAEPVAAPSGAPASSRVTPVDGLVKRLKAIRAELAAAAAR